uniref:Uncharacterized protein n=1 Tax=Romanomermis culicivorax TaxID=13658 RepID=A0A915K1X7_ROMCU
MDVKKRKWEQQEELKVDMDDNCNEKISKHENLITSSDIHQIKQDLGVQPYRLCEDEMAQKRLGDESNHIHDIVIVL